ncbi:hypothetical protein [Mucilaginibacter dorajii]|uniref:Uncharacterized protein n=1 Tax=Mucilaginibacter dorajii TaxID=692994 RepID=A0ABP7QZQ7_9SPHI|nr:hypothetical protein [Mucilaginibacter dorajii]MCS3732253.1 hypothetical protein [Mucilaginibacter dorajii]
MFKIINSLNEETGVYDINFVMTLLEKYKEQYNHFFGLYQIANMQPNKLQKVVVETKARTSVPFCKKSYPEVTFRKKPTLFLNYWEEAHWCPTSNEIPATT